MDPNRRTTSLPKGMIVRILSVTSRGGNIYGIDADEVSKHTGISIDDHKQLSDWASVNDAHFYAENTRRFSYDSAATQAAAMCLPRVVLFHIPDKSKLQEPEKKEQVPAPEVKVAVKKRPPRKKTK